MLLFPPPCRSGLLLAIDEALTDAGIAHCLQVLSSGNRAGAAAAAAADGEGGAAAGLLGAHTVHTLPEAA